MIMMIRDMIVEVDEGVTTNDNWVWIDPISLEASIVIGMETKVLQGIPEITPVSESRDSPEGRDPEVIENWRRSPDMIGAVEK